jgi:hypothetical protein
VIVPGRVREHQHAVCTHKRMPCPALRARAILVRQVPRFLPLLGRALPGVCAV